MFKRFIPTGEVMREITDPNIRPLKDYVYDMCVDGDTLITLRFEEKTVLYYKLNYEQ